MDSNQKNVLVPTDFSEVCDNAISYAVETAKTANYKIYLLHVIDKNTKTSLKKEGLTEESIDAKLKSIADKIKANDHLEVETIAREGNIFTTIGEVAKEVEANMLILGTHGKVGKQKLNSARTVFFCQRAHGQCRNEEKQCPVCRTEKGLQAGLVDKKYV